MEYKFEKFRDPGLPVYCSTQQGAGQLVKPHYHNACELLWVLQGQGELLINTRKITAREQEIYFIPRGCIHSLFSCREDTRICGIVFEEQIFHPHSLPAFARDALSPVNVTEHLVSSLPDSPLHRQFSAVLDSYANTAPCGNLDLMSNLYKLMSLLLQHFGDTVTTADTSRIAPAIAYLQKNYHKKLHLSELSRLLYTCDDHLIRLFKTHTGKTPIRFLTDLRIEQAMKLLTHTDLPIAQIAEQTGFTDAAYLSKAFRQAIGMTPRQYRMQKSKQ